jgi:membrane protein implicated in regulation of membrane protease activity
VGKADKPGKGQHRRLGTGGVSIGATITAATGAVGGSTASVSAGAPWWASLIIATLSLLAGSVLAFCNRRWTHEERRWRHVEALKGIEIYVAARVGGSTGGFTLEVDEAWAVIGLSDDAAAPGSPSSDDAKPPAANPTK